MQLLHRGRLACILSAGALGFGCLGSGSALAAFPDDNVKLYTGCLNPGGSINNLQEGDSPSQPCSPPAQVVKLSGGDITRVTVTGALTGGGDNGAVTIGLDASKTVPGTCAQGQVPKWNGAAWACGADNDTQYGAGTGLSLASGTFSIAPPYRLPDFTSAGSGCNDGDTVVIRNGQWSCASPTPTSAGIETWLANGYGDAPANFEPVPGASLTLPPGAYLILFSGYAIDAEDLGGIPGSGNGDVSTYCVLVDNAGRGVGAPDIATFVDAAKTAISGSAVVQSTDRTPTFHLECTGNQDYVQVYMTAIKVGVMH
jgi:hypothetical protein